MLNIRGYFDRVLIIVVNLCYYFPCHLLVSLLQEDVSNCRFFCKDEESRDNKMNDKLKYNPNGDKQKYQEFEIFKQEDLFISMISQLLTEHVLKTLGTRARSLKCL